MSISNCSAAGADSVAQAVTGIVQRRDKATGVEVGAPVRPVQGVAAVKAEEYKGGASLSGAVLGALLGAQEG